MEQEEPPAHFLVKHVSLGDVLVLVSSLIVFAFGYGRLPNVFTSMEFERMSNAAGPTGGRIVLRDGRQIDRTLPDYAELDDLMGPA